VRSPGRPGRIEAESLAFHERVREAFRALAADDPDRYLVIDASEESTVIAFKIRERVHRLLRRPGSVAPRR